ncbi:MAG: alpha-L-rhamnosidase [Opitutaceae bacterium]|nr:alpha-L-rhamnosidase [Opitutaceae bacterium]
MHAPTGLLCDLLARPELTTIANLAPTFGWILNSENKADRQTAYQVLVASTGESLRNHVGDAWDTDKLIGNDSINLPYTGSPLQTGATYFWSVRVWGIDDTPSPWSASQRFTIATDASPQATSHYPVVPHRFTAEEVTGVSSYHHFIDFGKHAFGWLEVTLDSPEETTVEVRLGEHAENQRVDLNPGGTIRSAKSELKLKAGRHQYRIETEPDKRNTEDPLAVQLPLEFGVVMPFRYVEIIGHPGPIAREDIVQVRLEYPFDATTSSFTSSEPDLDEVWAFCKYSIRATTFCGVYVDGDRERIPYEADAFINQLGHYAVDREFTLARRTHEYLMAKPTWPTEWLQHSVMLAWADYEATGDSRTLARHYDQLRTEKILFKFERSDGLLNTEGQKDIVDWPADERDNFDFRPINTVVNAFHCHTLNLMSRIATTLGHTIGAADFEATATRATESFNRVCFNPETGLYRDGEDSAHESFHASLFPLALGLVPDEVKEGVVEYLKSRGMACSVYAAQYLLDGLFSSGAADHAVSLLKSREERSWYNMLTNGATITWEAWDNRFKPNQDWNHAWGAAPANLIPRHILGVQPLEPGYGRVRIAPQPGPLTELHGVVPTIRGTIKVDAVLGEDGTWQLDTEVPIGVTAEIITP